MSWNTLQTQLTTEQIKQITNEACQALAAVSLRTVRNRRQMNGRADAAVRGVIRQLGTPMPDANQLQTMVVCN